MVPRADQACFSVPYLKIADVMEVKGVSLENGPMNSKALRTCLRIARINMSTL